MQFATCLVVLGLLLAAPVRADVEEQAADHFVLGFQAQVQAPAAKVYVALSEVARWWSSEHTWSGKATNLSLKPEAGGCFCERWAEGSAEHGRVIMALKNELLRLDASLGPLQDLAVKGTLSFLLTPTEGGTTTLDVEYRVNGASGSGLDQLALPVDQVLAVQIDRLLNYIDTGKAESPAEAPAVNTRSKRDARAELLDEWASKAAADQATRKKRAKDAPPKH